MDYDGPIHGSMILVLIDAYSMWIEAHVVSSSTYEVTIVTFVADIRNTWDAEIYC